MEVFVDIKNYEGRYKISNHGNIYSTPQDGKPERILKFDISGKGYRRVTLSKHGKTKRFLVHRLVAEHFLDNVACKEYVNHVDNEPSNNKVDNLEWCTHSENMIHAQSQGRLFESQSKGGHKGKLKSIEKSMRQIEDSTGLLYGYWKSTGEYIKSDSGNYKIKSICTLCNTVKYVDKSSLLNGKTKSCVKCANTLNWKKRKKDIV